MAFTSGIATDHRDLMDKLITFLITLSPSNQKWTLLDTKSRFGVFSGQIGEMREWYLRGPGLAATDTLIDSVTDSTGIARFSFTPGPTLTIGDEVIISGFTVNVGYNGVYNVTNVGTGYFEIDTIPFGSDEAGSFLTNAEEIYFNMRDFVVESPQGDADNFELNPAINYDSAKEFRSQTGTIYLTNSTFRCYVALSSSSFPYWFVATGRYFLVATAVSTINSIFGGGFYLPYALPSEFPYPMFTIGTTNIFNERWNISDDTHLNFYGQSNEDNVASFLRHRDGQWIKLLAKTGLPLTSELVSIFPCQDGEGYNIINNQDSSYTLLPYIPYSGFSGGNVYGELENIYWVSQFNISAQDIVTINLVDHLVLQNVWKTSDNIDYCALKLE